MLVGAVVNGVADVFSRFGELLVVRRGRCGGVEQFVEFAAAVLDVDELGAQVADPVAALDLGQGAGFECEQVAFDGCSVLAMSASVLASSRWCWARSVVRRAAAWLATRSNRSRWA